MIYVSGSDIEQQTTANMSKKTLDFSLKGQILFGERSGC